MTDLAVAQALVDQERRRFLDGMARYCVSKAETRDEAIDLLAKEIEEYVREMLNHTFYAIPKVVLAALPLPGGYWEADSDLDYRNIASLLMTSYWDVGLPKPSSSKNRRPTAGRPGPSASRAGKAPTKKAPAKKSANRAPSRRY